MPIQKKRLLAAAFLVILPSVASAAVRVAGTSGWWSSSVTWGGAGVPASGDICIVNAGVRVIVGSGANACGRLVIDGSVRFDGARGRTLTIGDGAGALDDNLTINAGGELLWGAGQHVIIDTDNPLNVPGFGRITVNGRLRAVGKTMMTKGTITGIGGIAGNAPVVTSEPGGAGEGRRIVLTDATLRQSAVDSYAGLVLVPTTGYFRWQWFDIVPGGSTIHDIVVDMDSRGALDSRHQAGRVDPVCWRPGDWGAIVSTGLASVASGATDVLLNRATPGVLPGDLFVCAADIGEAGDFSGFRVIDKVIDPTRFTLASGYGTSNCDATHNSGAGAPFRIYQMNQPPVAAAIEQRFSLGDQYMIIDPAVLSTPAAMHAAGEGAAHEPCGDQEHQLYVVQNDGGTIDLHNASVGWCGSQRPGGGLTDLSCIQVNRIDNTSPAEGFHADTVEIHHFSGVGGITLIDSSDITVSRLLIRDAAEGGRNNAAEAHGFRTDDEAAPERVKNIVLQDSRIVRTNDVGVLFYDAQDSADHVGCSNCSVLRTFVGFVPTNGGTSAQCMAFTQAVTNLRVEEVFATNCASGIVGIAGGQLAEDRLTTTATVRNSILQNSPVSCVSVSRETGPSAVPDADMSVAIVGNLIRGCGSAASRIANTRGRYYYNYIDAMSDNLSAVMSSPAALYGNVLIGPDRMVSTNNGVLAFNHLLSPGPAPAVVKVWDNVVLGPAVLTSPADTVYLGGQIGSASGSANDYDIQHNTFYGLRDQESPGGPAGFRTMAGAGRTHTFMNNIFANTSYGLGSAGNEAGRAIEDYNIFWNYQRGPTFLAVPPGPNDYCDSDVGACTQRARLGFVAPSLADFTLQRVGCCDDAGDCQPAAGRGTAVPPLDEPPLRLCPFSPILGSDGTVIGSRGAGPRPASLRRVYPFLQSFPRTDNGGLLDADGDGIPDIHDDCPFVVNPDQADADGDGHGDPCDLEPEDFDPLQRDTDRDGVGDVRDNCIFAPNSDQADINHDGVGDACDPGDGLIFVFLPDASEVTWQMETGFESFNEYRGDLDVLRASGIYTQDPRAGALAIRNCGLVDPYVYDGPDPAAGKGVFYLVTGVRGGAEGSLGRDSAGFERPNASPCP